MTGVSEVLDDALAPSEELVLEPTRKRRRPVVRWLVEWSLVLVLALVAALLMRAYVFQTFYIPSASMEPTLHVGDRIIVSKLSVEWGSINRGDILVFKRPAGEVETCMGPVVNDLVKRVIGLPNEYLYNAGNSIYWSSSRVGPWHLIVQNWSHNLPLGTQPIGTESKPAYVPPGHLFMLGDNEDDSCDSRYWGPIPRNLVVGKVILRIWPLSRLDFL